MRRWTAGVLVGLGIMLLLVVPALAAGVFPDVPYGHPYGTAIEDLVARGIIGGRTDGSFGPEDAVMRQQYAKIVVKSMNIPVTGSEICPFDDVATQSGTDPFYPSKYVAVCAQNNITKGRDATHFDPYANISRLQAVTTIIRAIDNLRPGTLQNPPAGWTGVLAYGDATHGENLRKAEYNGLLTGLQGLSGSWNGYTSASRGECAQLLHNLILFPGDGGGSTASTQPSSGTTTVDEPMIVQVPNVTGMDVEEAIAVLSDCGLQATITYAETTDAPTGRVLEQSPSAGQEISVGGFVELIVAKSELVKVPSVLGTDESQAKSILTQAGLSYQITYYQTTDYPPGQVISQSPAAGSLVAKGSVVALVVAKNKDTVQVPNVRAMDVEQAKNVLTQAGLSYQITYYQTTVYPPGQVISQSPAAGTSVAKGSAVALLVAMHVSPFPQ